jgi:hypothetical protein
MPWSLCVFVLFDVFFFCCLFERIELVGGDAL